MTRDRLQRALIDLGWLALIQRALGGKPSSTYALHQLMRAAGRPVSWSALAAGYDEVISASSMARAGQGKLTSGTPTAIAKRIERLRAALSDMGCRGAIKTSEYGHGSYLIEKRDIPRIEAALLFACGFALDEEAAA
jgi:hypothetical protein